MGVPRKRTLHGRKTMKTKRALTVIAGNFENKNEDIDLYDHINQPNEFKLEMLEDARPITLEAQESIRKLQRMLACRYVAPSGLHLRRS